MNEEKNGNNKRNIQSKYNKIAVFNGSLKYSKQVQQNENSSFKDTKLEQQNSRLNSSLRYTKLGTTKWHF